MGDRGNIFFADHHKDDEHFGGMYFYTHHAGSYLWEITRDALRRGQSRWGDTQYLARIVFCELVRGIEMDTTGAGLGTVIGDNGHQIIRIDDESGIVSFHAPGTETLRSNTGTAKWTYQEYIDLPVEDLMYRFQPELYD